MFSSSRPASREILAAALTNPVILAVLWALAINHAWIMMKHLHTRVNRHDFSVYYLSASAFRDHSDPYTTELNSLGARFDLQVGDLDQATDPPTFLLFFEPLTLLTPTTAYWVWIALNFACFLTALMLLQMGLPARIQLLLFPLALLYAPLSSHFHWGQSKLPVLLLLVLVMRTLERGWERLSGVILAFAGLTRLFPLLLVAYLLLQKKWNVVLYCGVGLLVVGLLTLVLGGVSQTVHFINAAVFLSNNKWLAYTSNISLRAFVSRLFSWSSLEKPSMDFFKSATILAAELGILTTTIRATLAATRGRDYHWRLFSLWVVTSIMLSPIAWDHYMVLLFILFFKLTLAAVEGQADRRSIYMAVGSYLCADFPLILSAAGLWPSNWLITASAENDFVALALAYISAYWLAVSRQA
jgi:Glycosyltransferase family 87